jgi:anti-sigma factor RsiW
MTTPPPKPDDDDVPGGPTEELVAYLDGELDPKAAEAMATKLSLDAKLRAEADALQRAWDILDILPKPTPSVSFTTKTISQAIPVASGSQPTLPTPVASGSRTTMTAPVPLPSHAGAGFWIAAAVVLVAAGFAGYFGHALLAPPKGERDLEAQMMKDMSIKDLSVLKNARLFHHVDDMEYIKQLDTPDLFGDEGD